MKNTSLAFLTGLIIAFLVIFNSFYGPVDTVVDQNLTLQTVNGGATDYIAKRSYTENKSSIKNVVNIIAASFLVLSITFFIKNMKQTKNILLAACLSGLFLVTSGCKPYDKPEYVEIGTSETAFVIPLEGESPKAQVKFDSASYLESKKVSSKRIDIPHRWNQTGRLPFDGEWIDSVRVIKVDRTPITRQWSVTSENAKIGSRTASGAIWLESSDSIGFSMGFNCTAYVSEEDTTKFLYWYKGSQLAEVMDSEIKARYQQAAAEIAAQVKIDLLREQKQKIVDAIRKDIVPFFKERGITITTIGQFGGMTYENQKIQSAIDETFISQQEKVVANAKLVAQEDINKRIELEATALAEKARRQAKGEADAKLIIAEAEAKSLATITEALNKAANNPQLLALRAIEVEKLKTEKWNGSYPQTYFGGGKDGANFLFQIPSPSN